eukprot:19651-Pelagococcus_subviridis.AAC.2
MRASHRRRRRETRSRTRTRSGGTRAHHIVDVILLVRVLDGVKTLRALLLERLELRARGLGFRRARRAASRRALGHLIYLSGVVARLAERDG